MELDEDTAQEVRARLETERQQERERLDGMDIVEPGKSVHNESRNEAGMAQMGLTARQRSERQAVIEHTRERIKQIDDALDRLDEGTYGRCDVCGEAIAPERTVSVPLATRCVDCAEDDPRPAP